MNKSIVSGLLSILLVASVHAELSYRIYPVGDTGSGGAAYAWGLNDRGDVVGTTSVGYQDTPYVWHEGIAIRIPVNGEAWAINDSGVVVGSADRGPYSWNGKTVTWLPGDGEATAINSSGEIVGRADDADNHFQATIWKNGTLSQPYLRYPYESFAEAINDEGDVVGESMNGPMYAFLDRNGIITRLRGGNWDWAYGINNKDQVVGVSMHVDQDGSVAALWQNGTFKRLPSLPGSRNDEASAINDNGWIVGASEGADDLDDAPGARATLWINDVPTDLNALIPANSGWVLYNCKTINNRGQIIGEGLFKGQTRSFIMTPTAIAIPLPSPLLIGVVTLPLAMWMSRRRIGKSV